MYPPGVSYPRGHVPQGGLRQPADDRRRRRHAASGKRAAAQRGVRPLREARVRLRARLASRRSPALGQSLLVARAHRFSLERAPADAAHDRQGNSASVLSKRAPDAPPAPPSSAHARVAFKTANSFSTSSSVFHTCGVTRMAWPRTETKTLAAERRIGRSGGIPPSKRKPRQWLARLWAGTLAIPKSPCARSAIACVRSRSVSRTRGTVHSDRSLSEASATGISAKLLRSPTSKRRAPG